MEKYKIKIIYTSDVHGSVLPVNYSKNTLEEKGLSRLKTYIESIDMDYLLLDNGDILQGTPIMNYWINNCKDKISPVNLVMNELGYDYVNVGNHDFNYGKDILNSYINNLNAKVICCNILNDKNELLFSPYEIITLDNGIKIGLIGAVTQYIPHWEKKENIEGLYFADAYESVKKYVGLIASNVDALVVLYHGGLERNITTGDKVGRDNDENEGYRIASDLSIDVLLTGHQHVLTEGFIGKTLVLQPTSQAYNFGEVELEFTKTYDKWQLSKKDGKIKPMIYESSIKVEDLVKYYEDKVNLYLDKIIANIEGESLLIQDEFLGRLNNHPLFDLINKAQLEVTGAMISCSSLPNHIRGLNKSVTIRDLESTFIYPNSLYVIEIDGKTLKAALEKCATYFTMEEGKININPSFMNPKVEHYNYDVYAGIEYEIDVSKPFGQRITKLLFKDKQVKDTDVFTLAINNYRAIGGGDYTMFNDSKVITTIDKTTSELITEYLKRHPEIFITKLTNPVIKL